MCVRGTCRHVDLKGERECAACEQDQPQDKNVAWPQGECGLAQNAQYQV
jgi:hypothetical protein